MENNKQQNNFRVNRVSQLKKLYSDDVSTRREANLKALGKVGKITDAKDVRKLLSDSIDKRSEIINTSNYYYASSPLYAAVINYLSNMFLWKYKVIPHKVYSKGKAAKNNKKFEEMYNLMLEVVDGISIETKFPSLLSKMYINGAVYFTTIYDKQSLSLQTIILPNDYCEKVGETQFGTNVIRFNYKYFEDIGLEDDQLKLFLESFTPEIQKGYKQFKKNPDKFTYQILDSKTSSAILTNDLSIPTYFYLLGSILGYEKYEDIEIKRRENMLKYIVVHNVPVYQDQLVFSVPEVQALHNSTKRIIETSDYAKLLTTYGDVHVETMGDKDTAENNTLQNAYESIFNNAAFNSGLFSGDTATSLELSLIRDRGSVWKYVQELVNFYTIAINNCCDFKPYQADIEILPISSYTYKDDIEIYKNNATLGVGKLDYLIASGIKQKNIQDIFELEKFLKLEQIAPMQTSYTQTAEDRKDTDDEDKKENPNEKKSEIEPSEENSKTADKDE